MIHPDFIYTRQPCVTHSSNGTSAEESPYTHVSRSRRSGKRSNTRRIFLLQFCAPYMGIYSCFIPDRNCEFARFQTVKNQTSCKRSKINFTTKPLLQYSFPPAFTKSGIGFCNATRSKRQDTAKLHIFGEIQNQKTVGRARERSTVCKDKSVCLNQNFQPRRTRGCTLVVKVKSWPPNFDSVVCTSLMPLVIVVTSVFTLPGNMSVMVNPSSTPTKRPL